MIERMLRKPKLLCSVPGIFIKGRPWPAKDFCLQLWQITARVDHEGSDTVEDNFMYSDFELVELNLTQLLSKIYLFHANLACPPE